MKTILALSWLKAGHRFKKVKLTVQTFNKSIKRECVSYSVSAEIKDIDTLCWG